jgi:hypothetical protein
MMFVTLGRSLPKDEFEPEPLSFRIMMYTIMFVVIRSSFGIVNRLLVPWACRPSAKKTDVTF